MRKLRLRLWGIWRLSRATGEGLNGKLNGKRTLLSMSNWGDSWRSFNKACREQTEKLQNTNTQPHRHLYIHTHTHILPVQISWMMQILFPRTHWLVCTGWGSSQSVAGRKNNQIFISAQWKTGHFTTLKDFVSAPVWQWALCTLWQWPLHLPDSFSWSAAAAQPGSEAPEFPLPRRPALPYPSATPPADSHYTCTKKPNDVLISGKQILLSHLHKALPVDNRWRLTLSQEFFYKCSCSVASPGGQYLICSPLLHEHMSLRRSRLLSVVAQMT